MYGPVKPRLVTIVSAHCRSASDQGQLGLARCSCSCQARHSAACVVTHSRRPLFRMSSTLLLSHTHGRSTASGRAAMYGCTFNHRQSWVWVARTAAQGMWWQRVSGSVPGRTHGRWAVAPCVREQRAESMRIERAHFGGVSEATFMEQRDCELERAARLAEERGIYGLWAWALGHVCHDQRYRTRDHGNVLSSSDGFGGFEAPLACGTRQTLVSCVAACARCSHAGATHPETSQP